ncbi:MAG: hypothetical protein KDA96_25355, partial [Planctomycetaceae bacterium]|nr:hypothetical protein [Planctomycetaceae bacterium]
SGRTESDRIEFSRVRCSQDAQLVSPATGKNNREDAVDHVVTATRPGTRLLLGKIRRAMVTNVTGHIPGVFRFLNKSHTPEPSDGSLLRRFRCGEQEAATRLYLRYAQRLLQLARNQAGHELRTRLDPEDIVQSVFRTFFRRASEGHYEVPDGEELWKLFLVIGLNKIRDAAVFHRAGKRDVGRTVPLATNSEISLDASGNELAEATIRMVIDDLMTDLTRSQQEIIMLRLHGTQVADISEKTQRSRRTVERTLQKFRDLLKQQIDFGSLSNQDEQVDET